MTYIEIKEGKLYRDQTPYLLRGFGLGGWLLPEGYMWGLYTKCDRPRHMEKMIETLCGADYALKFWEKYFESYITKQDIKLIAEQGFNSVRLPLNARHLYSLSENECVLNLKTIGYIDQLIQWCKEYDVYIILDMHGAPGGQTGTNIDDSLDDQPRLFMDKQHEQELIDLWGMLANRYKDEPTVAAYDLLNEPLPNWFSQYNHKLMPLYQAIIKKIRDVDTNHLIILEGLHWATDFTVFETIGLEAACDGLVLEFHKYWSNPDQESLTPYIEASKRLNAPLFMGEGGENNLDWYTTIFPLYDRLNISWSFWSYKKMCCDNSPMTFDTPNGWDKIILWVEQNDKTIVALEAQEIFDAFLHNLSHSKINVGVYNALKRKAPLTIPAESYDAYRVAINKERAFGAAMRLTDPINIFFESGKTGDVDYKRYDGAPQPPEENLFVQLLEEEILFYNFNTEDNVVVIEIYCLKNPSADLKIKNILVCSIEDQAQHFTITDQDNVQFIFQRKRSLLQGKKHHTAHQLKIKCESGVLLLDNIEMKRGS